MNSRDFMLIEDFFDRLADSIVMAFERSLIPSELQDDFLRAWQQSSRATLHQLRTAEESKLEFAGLSGGSLEFELGAFQRSVRYFQEERRRSILHLVALDKSKRSRSNRFKKVLAWANVILGSIAQVVPGGEALKELKEGIEVEAHQPD